MAVIPIGDPKSFPTTTVCDPANYSAHTDMAPKWKEETRVAEANLVSPIGAGGFAQGLQPQFAFDSLYVSHHTG